MRLVLIVICPLTLLLSSINLFAVTAQLSVIDKSNVLNISDITLPVEMLISELDSGLPNTISIIIKVNRNSKVLEKRMISTTIIYDLWDEVYTVNIADISGLREKKYNKKSSIIESLKYATLSNIKLVDLQGVPHKDTNVTIQTVYNPIEQAKIKKIQDWIMSSNGFSKSGNFEVSLKNSGELRSGSAKGLRFQRLFEKLVENYAQEDGFSAQWKSQVDLIPIYIGKIRL